MTTYIHVWVGLDSVTCDVEWSNNKDNEFVECFRDVFLTQTVKKKIGIEKDIPLICLA